MVSDFAFFGYVLSRFGICLICVCYSRTEALDSVGCRSWLWAVWEEEAALVTIPSLSFLQSLHFLHISSVLYLYLFLHFCDVPESLFPSIIALPSSTSHQFCICEGLWLLSFLLRRFGVVGFCIFGRAKNRFLLSIYLVFVCSQICTMWRCLLTIRGQIAVIPFI